MARPRVFYDQIINGKKVKLVRVSKVLSHMEDKTNLFKWIERTGEKEAKKICKSAAATGTTIHSALQSFFTEPETYYQKVSKFNADELKFLRNYDLFLRNYKSYSSEKQVYYVNNKLRFCGTCDNIGWINPNAFYLDKECRNKLYIEDNFITLDFKNYAKHKDQQYLVKSFLQLGAYTIAWNYLHPTKTITNSLLVVSSKQQLNLYYLDKRKIEFFSQEFLKGLDCYIRKDKYDWHDLLARAGYKYNEERGYGICDSKTGYFPIRLYCSKPIELEF